MTFVDHLSSKTSLLVGGSALAVMLLLNPGSGAKAAEQSRPQATEEQRTACRADFVRLCPETMPGDGRVKQCFVTHYAELSEQCRSAVDANGVAP